jgi:ribosomal protein L37AE/L43A
MDAMQCEKCGGKMVPDPENHGMMKCEGCGHTMPMAGGAEGDAPAGGEQAM